MPGGRLRNSMPVRVYMPKDEELGKRDDDFRPVRSSSSSSTSLYPRWRKRRFAGLIAALLFIYVFVKNIPTDLGPANRRIDSRLAVPVSEGENEFQVAVGGQVQEPLGAPPRPAGGRLESDKHYYDGPIKFYRLATSLHSISRTMGSRPANRNVLFAVSSLKSAANLMPMACDMAKWDRNYVHMAFLGRDPLALDDILEINGVVKEDCAVYFHDARGDYSEYSSEARAEHAVAGAMKHVENFMHPQAIIMDDSKVEDIFFTRAMRAKAKGMFRTLIEVPHGKVAEFMWMARLDSGSLSSWFKPNLDIVIQAPPGTSGGIIRTVKSLENANYAGLKIPHLTIEMPNDVPHVVLERLKHSLWPPGRDIFSPLMQKSLTLRHRISTSRLSSEHAALRQLESFFPVSSEDDHVLVLSPQIEISPLFMQYLHYSILEYRYSSYGSPHSSNLLGISLEVPSTFLSGKAGFVAPKVKDTHSHKYLDDGVYDQDSPAPFLYQAPSSTASLIFGDKWVTLHNFLSNRLIATHSSKVQKTQKLVSETEPAWLEYLLELVRTRGWTMLHPATSFVTVHNDLAQLPEEYATSTDERKQIATEAKTDPESASALEEPYLTAPDPPALAEHIEAGLRTTQALHELLPFEGDLPELSHLPYITYGGRLAEQGSMESTRNEYVQAFRSAIGGCEGKDARRKRVEKAMKTDDLFCGLPDVEIELDTEEEEEEEKEAENVANVIAEPMVDDVDKEGDS